jgi:ABC-2 type transport system permease protein
MTVPRTLQQGVTVARGEWRRHRREFGHPLTERSVTAVAAVVGAVGLGWLALQLGRGLASGQPLPYDRLSLLASTGFAWMVWRSSQYAHARFEQLRPELLLTTIPSGTAALGFLGFVYVRLVVTLAVPTVGVAVGLGVGSRSPTVGVTTVAAAAVMTPLAAAAGTTSRLVVRLIARHVTGARTYRDLLVVFGWIPLVLGAVVLQDVSLPVASLSAVFGALPLAWFVDLALAGWTDSPLLSPRRALAIMGVAAVSVPVLAAGTAGAVRRLWETTPRSSDSSGSRSLAGGGWVDRLLGDHVSRPVRTVTRERWLMERRTPRGLLSTGYVLLFFGVIGLPLLLFGGPNGILLLVAVALGMGVGIAFASDPIGTEYRTLPMLLTSVGGEQFVRGLLLSALLVGVPLVSVIVVPLGVVSVVEPAWTLLIALVGVASCGCTAAVELAGGLRVDPDELVPTPFFFTDVPGYTVPGVDGFVRLGSTLAVVSLANAVAFLGNAPSVYEPVVATGAPASVVQGGSLVLTLCVLTAVTRTAFNRAVTRVQEYQVR